MGSEFRKTGFEKRCLQDGDSVRSLHSDSVDREPHGRPSDRRRGRSPNTHGAAPDVWGEEIGVRRSPKEFETADV